jgi:hypothetical protein
MAKDSVRLPVINTPIITVPIEMFHYCPAHNRFRGGDGSQRAIKLCLHRHLDVPLYEETRGFLCGSCTAISTHIEVYGLRHQRRVPLSETRHRLVFTDERTGASVVTSTREWRRVERLGSIWFTKKIDGVLHAFDLYTARNMNIEGAWPKTEPVMTRIAANYPNEGKPLSAKAKEERVSARSGTTKTPPAKKGLEELTPGAMISAAARKLTDKAKRILSLRIKHVEKFT